MDEKTTEQIDEQQIEANEAMDINEGDSQIENGLDQPIDFEGFQDQVGATESVEQRLQRELAESTDRWVRSQAEIENVRRRTRRDMEEQAKFAAQIVINDLLEVVDNLNRATGAVDSAEDPTGLIIGVKMVVQQFEDVLKRHGCHRLQTDDQEFDPNFHEAIQMVPSDLASGRIVQEVRSGYKMHDRVLRPAQVIVSAGKAN